MQELQDALMNFVKSKNILTVFPAQVLSVDENEATCTVEDGDIELYDVRLKSLIDTSLQRVLVIPKVESSVLVANIGNSENAFVVIAVADVEKIIGKIGTTEFLVDSGGYNLKRNGQDFKGVLNALFDELKQAQVITPAGNGTFLPTVIANLTLIQSRLNQILQ
jgi:hypothetical protein